MKARAVRVIAAALIVSAGLTAPAYASIGAAIGSTPIQPERTLQPGHSYQLPEAYVKNPGTEPARYHLHIEKLSTGSGRSVPTSWVVPARNNFLLDPHKSTYVALTLNLPRNAPGGSYLSDVVVAAGPPRPVHGTALGAAAATKVIFQVADPGSGLPGWVTLMLIALAAVGLLALAIRRSGIRIHLEHGSHT